MERVSTKIYGFVFKINVKIIGYKKRDSLRGDLFNAIKKRNSK